MWLVIDMAYRKRFKVGVKKRKKKEEEVEEVEPKKSQLNTREAKNLLYEEPIDEDGVADDDSRDLGIIAVDVALDKIADIFRTEVEPVISKLAEGLDRDDFVMLREARAVLNEGVYPYLVEFSDIVDQLMGEGE